MGCDVGCVQNSFVIKCGACGDHMLVVKGGLECPTCRHFQPTKAFEPAPPKPTFIPPSGWHPRLPGQPEAKDLRECRKHGEK